VRRDRHPDDRVWISWPDAIDRLRAYAADIQREFGSSISVDGLPDGDAWFRITPSSPGACSLTFGDDQWIDFRPSRGVWEIDYTDEGFQLLDQLVHSVAAGRVTERLGARRSRTEITLANGTVEASNHYDGLTALIPDPGWRRRGSVTEFQPWV
jgi:hypothetical protein